MKKLERPKTEEWDDLERVLAEAVMKVVIGQLMKELLNYQNEKLKSGIPLYGRVALWHVFQKFQLESGTALSVEYQNLMSFTLGFMPSSDECPARYSNATSTSGNSALQMCCPSAVVYEYRWILVRFAQERVQVHL